MVESLPPNRHLDALTQAKVVVLSHQSRPGKGGFHFPPATLRSSAENCSQRVTFIDDVMGPAAREAIKKIKEGEILVLDNVRFCAEENLEEKAEKLAKTNLVTRLAPLFNLYVNDAFAAAHRAQASLVGFPYVLPSAAGRLMEKELAALEKLLERTRPTQHLRARRREGRGQSSSHREYPLDRKG